MSTGLETEKAPRKLAELHVFSELLKHGVVPYAPVADTGIDALVRTPEGSAVEVKINLRPCLKGIESRRFTLPEFKPRKELFIICVEFDGGGVGNVWVLPSMSFYAYSKGPTAKGLRNLDLDGGRKRYFGKPLREYISFFNNRWELISEYDHYRRHMDSAEGFEDLEDELLAKEAFENPDPDDEYLDWDDYARSRTESLSG